jgi:hypothetical protein
VPLSSKPVAALALLALLAAEVATARADPQRPRAAVLPTQGPLSPESRKTITIQFRSRIRERGYLLARQREVREAAARAGVEGPPTVEQLARIGREVDAGIVFSPLLAGQPGEGLRIELMGLRSPATALGPISERLAPADGPGLDLDEVEQAVDSLVERLLEPFPAVPVEQEVDLTSDQHDPPEQMKDYRGKLLDEYDHEGFMADLGFVLAFCQGETMCHESPPGYGARLRLGYRIRSVAAISVSGIVAGHELPMTTDLEDWQRANRSFVWAGVHGGFRIHPINRHWFDPFIGLDMGWTWMFYTEKATPPEDTEDCGLTIMGIPKCSSETSQIRNAVTLEGFTFTPQLGLRFFITRNVSLGVIAEWLLPVWREVCNEAKTYILNEDPQKESACVSIDKADADWLTLSRGALSDKSERPWFFNLEFDFAFTF